MKLFQILTHKCPRCGQGKIFSDKSYFTFEEVEKSCGNCSEKFEKEPGFFIGAMYMSYGLVTVELFIIFGIAQFFFQETFDFQILLIQTVFILLLSPFNYRLSRVIWVYLFSETNDPKS